jgi:uncharacterized protein (DUF1778 family)
MNENSPSLTLRLPKELKTAIEQAAKSQDLTVSQFIRRQFAHLNEKPARKRKTAAS